MKKVGSVLGDWWRLVNPYFRSEEWPIAIVLLVGAIALTLGSVGLEVLFNEWSRRFYDALEKKDEAAFWREIMTFSWLAALFIAAAVTRYVVSPYLRLRWRRWLTGRYLAHWLDGRGYYRIELERTIDNADQRIAEDLRQLGEYTMQLLLGFIGAVATLVSFLFILWQLSGPLSLKSIGLDVEIPGYMAIAALLFTEAQLTLYQAGYAQVAIIFPYLVTAPRFFAGAITLGVMMQTASAFGQVYSALSFFVTNYTVVAELRAVMDRLMGLQAASDKQPATAIAVEPQAGATGIGIEAMTLALPNGQTLLQDTTLAFPPGQSTLISGTSGSGKSTLFRALAGIWPFGRGHVRVPAGARVLFLPQKPYIPIGTLRDAIRYPDEHSTASDGEIVAALEAAQLGQLAGRLDEEAHWTNILSGGEQQRVAIARALVFKPDWLFLDEATASLDEATEEVVYGALKQRLPGTTIVSIGHRPSLRQWHERRLELQRKPGQVGRLVDAAV